MKKLISAVLAGVLTLSISTGITAHAQEKKYTTDTFMVQSLTEDNMLDSAPVNPEHKDHYLLDNKYELGDIVEVTYNNDEIIKEHKLTGKELQRVENKYEKNINALMEEGMRKTQESNIVTDNYMIQNIDKDGFATAKIVSDAYTGTAKFYVKKNYNLGDIVSVTFNEDTGKIIEHHEVSDDVRMALMNVDGYKPVIKKIMHDGKQTKNLIMAEDGTFVAPSFYN